MKISYRNNPVLQYLTDGKFKKLPVHKDDADFFYSNNLFKDTFKNTFKNNVLSYKSDINVMSKSFSDAMKEAKFKLLDLFKDILKTNKHDLNVAGTYINYGLTHLINFQASKDSDSISVSYFLFSKIGAPMMFHMFNNIDGDLYWLSKPIKDTLKSELEMKLNVQSFMVVPVIAYLFKHFATVETKFLPANKKIKDINCKYVNDTKCDITHLDSNWFTTLVQSNEFKVRGHFRLQPKKKDGNWTKEIIWINEFKKNGYTRKAKILTL